MQQQPHASSGEWLGAPDKYELASGHCRLNHCRNEAGKFLIWRIFSFTTGKEETENGKP